MHTDLLQQKVALTMCNIHWWSDTGCTVSVIWDAEMDKSCVADTNSTCQQAGIAMSVN